MERSEIKKEDPSDRYEITVMPDKKLLEDFLRGMGEKPVEVVFNTQIGVFERIRDQQISQQIDEVQTKLDI